MCAVDPTVSSWTAPAVVRKAASVPSLRNCEFEPIARKMWQSQSQGSNSLMSKNLKSIKRKNKCSLTLEGKIIRPYDGTHEPQVLSLMGKKEQIYASPKIDREH